VTTRTSSLALSLVVFLAAPLVATTATSGKGTELSKPAGQIVADAERAMEVASNFHVQGLFDQGGTATTLNLTMSRSAGGGGSVRMGTVTLQLVVAGRNVYMKADEKSWLKLTGSKATAELVANRWIEAPVSTPDLSSFAELTDSKAFISQLTSGQEDFAKLPVTPMWGGHKAIILKDDQGDTLYVVDGATPYMLHLQGNGAGASGYLTFSDFGTAPMPTIPVNAISLPNS
jgi:hypothetical protein